MSTQKNGNKQIWVKDVMIELLFCTRILKSTTIPGDLNDRIDRPRLSVRQVPISIPGYESFVQIGCTLRTIHIFLIFKTFLINKKTSLINISTPIMLSFSSFSEDLLFFKKVLENNVWNSKLDFAWWNLNQSYIPNLIMILKICIGKHSYHIVNTDRSENSEW